MLSMWKTKTDKVKIPLILSILFTDKVKIPFNPLYPIYFWNKIYFFELYFCVFFPQLLYYPFGILHEVVIKDLWRIKCLPF